MRIADRIALGFPPLRHNEPAVELGLRNVVYGLAIKDGDADLSGSTEEQSVGDLNGASLWRAADKGKRPMPGWSFAWAAQVARPEVPRGGSGGSGGSGGGAGGGGGGGVDANGRTPYGAAPAAVPTNPGFATYQTPGGGNPFNFFGAQQGSLGLIQQSNLGIFGTQPAGTQLGLIAQQNLGLFGAQPPGTQLTGAKFTSPAGTTVSGAPVLHTSSAAPASGAAPSPGSGQNPGGSGGGGGVGGSGAVGGGGGGIPGAPAAILPTYDAAHRIDDRFGLKSASEPPWASKRPRGWPGVVMAGSNEDVQEDIFIPAGSALVSANAPDADPTLSTAVVDVTKDGAVDSQRRVPLGDAWRVVHDPLGLGKNSLSWVLTPTAPYAPWFGGMVTDLDRAASNTQIRGGQAAVVHGLVSSRTSVASTGFPSSGPFDVGDSTDKHRLGEDADGNAINPVHISTDALYLMRSADGNSRDGPIDFRPEPFPRNLQRGPSKVPVYIAFDPTASYNGSGGAWRAYAEALIDDDVPYYPPTTTPPPTAPPPTTPTPPTTPPTTTPPTTPPPTINDKWILYPLGDGPDQKFGPHKPRPGEGIGPYNNPLSGGVGVAGMLDKRPDLPSKPYVGPTVITTPRPLAQMHRELAVPALLIKPHSFGCGRPDLRNDQGGDEEAQERHKREDPVVFRIEGAWLKTGEACNSGVPDYTNRPGNARYASGTADGIVAFLPPEVGMEDAATSFAPPGIDVSTVHIVTLKGKTVFGSGIPDPTTTLIKSGWKWGARTSDDKFAFVSTTSAGADDKTAALPNLSGTIPVASSISANALPKWSGTTGEQAPSGVTDDGSIVAVSARTLSAQKGWARGYTYAEMGGDDTLTESGSTSVQAYKTGGGAYNLNLPATPTTGLCYEIISEVSGTGDITVKSSSGTTVAVLSPGEWCRVIHEGGNSWRAWGVF